MADATVIDPVIGGEWRNGGIDWVIARLAGRQHGLVARAQLLAVGALPRAIDHRVERGRLHLVHRGVYAVGHRVLSPAGGWMAAVLACGEGAVLSHRSAAALWEIRSTSRADVDVTVHRKLRRRPGIQCHHSDLPPDEVTTLRGIPVTTPARTLLDLAAVLDRRRVERAANEAEIRRLADTLSLEDLVARHPCRVGLPTIRAILEAGAIGAAVTRSELEDRFLVFLEGAGLPRPQVNAALWLRERWIEADCLWRPQRLVVELDGHATHRTAAAYEGDRRRDRALSAAGWRVVRVTWRQLHGEPEALAADLRTLLARPPDPLVSRSVRPPR
jgi:hypothetical protein